MGLEVLVHPERVQCGCVEPGQEHIDHDDKVYLAILDSAREVFVVVLELRRRGVVRRAEGGVVVADRAFEEVAGGGVQPIRVHRLVIEDATDLLSLVNRVAEDRGDLQGLVGRSVAVRSVCCRANSS